jgi:hypothetical protein
MKVVAEQPRAVAPRVALICRTDQMRGCAEEVAKHLFVRHVRKSIKDVAGCEELFFDLVAELFDVSFLVLGERDNLGHRGGKLGLVVTFLLSIGREHTLSNLEEIETDLE